MKRLTMVALLAASGLVPSARAQLTGGALGGATGGVPTAATALGSGGIGAVAAPQKTIWGFFGISKANCAACKQKLCASQLGQMLNNGMAPLSGVSGGLIGPFCSAVPTAADIAALSASGASPAVVAAAKIKADEADAKARVAAIEYLGTVDCNYWPEAQEALLTALRKDRNECVRYAAARVLSNGCCCSRETIRKLTITVMGMGAVGANGKTEDGAPAESSERVRCAAMVALQTCLPIVPPEAAPAPPAIELSPEAGPFNTSPPPAPKPEGLPGPTTALTRDDGLARAAFLRNLNRKSTAELVRDAKLAMQIVGKQEPSLFMTGNRTLMNAIAKARTTPQAVAAANPVAADAVQTLNAPPAVEMLPAPPSTAAEAPPAQPPVVEPAPAPTPAPAPGPGLPPLPSNIPMPAEDAGSSAARGASSYRTLAHTAAKPVAAAPAPASRPKRSVAAILAGDLRGQGVASR